MPRFIKGFRSAADSPRGLPARWATGLFSKPPNLLSRAQDRALGILQAAVDPGVRQGAGPRAGAPSYQAGGLP